LTTAAKGSEVFVGAGTGVTVDSGGVASGCGVTVGSTCRGVGDVESQADTMTNNASSVSISSFVCLINFLPSSVSSHTIIVSGTGYAILAIQRVFHLRDKNQMATCAT
jgi:hypothetical protein